MRCSCQKIKLTLFQNLEIKAKSSLMFTHVDAFPLKHL